MADDPRIAIERATRAQLTSRLRVGILATASAGLTLLCLPNIVRGWEHYQPAWVQLVSFTMLAGVLGVEAALVVRGRLWPAAWRWPAVGVVVLAAVLSYSALPHGHAASAGDWVFGEATWVGLVVLLSRPLRVHLAFLGLHWGVALANMLLTTDVDRTTVLRFATGSIGVIGYPLCMAVTAAAFRGIARSAAAAKWETEQVAAAEAAAAESHRRRQQRFADLDLSTMPLLEGLASGRLDPADPAVRRECAVEAARMRRLFAEVDVVPNRLLHELRHCAEVADRKGVLVELDARGQWPDLPLPVRRDLTEAPLTVLATAASWARVTVVGGPDLVSVNVLADCGPLDLPRPAAPGVRLEAFGTGERLWVEVRWQATTSPR
ncbi:hypothetical protein RB614_28720 [Phytohabitans sp. ZYX-F-186]|uniref:Uncharacterized protein n=1 Tax=Phytohabitans maris TaxID=3071409 RepID=A0ABU0ZNA9_9ACTN|nr:hypothetical protein [Phytohabitans sp. ZYX-F-186]MDQ7908520.1 hypothetical protein [Phytohabitans sp. ZYX-F-186]